MLGKLLLSSSSTHAPPSVHLIQRLPRYSGFRKSILLDRRKLVELLDLHLNKTMAWDEFSLAVRRIHEHRMGQPTRRKVVRERPKEEDYFYANPQECLEHWNNQQINNSQ